VEPSKQQVVGLSAPSSSVGISGSKWALLGLACFLLASIVAATHLGGLVNMTSIRLYGSAAFEAILGFLAISGFSIAYSYQSKPAGYLRRRAERILPTYWASIVYVLWASLVLGRVMPTVLILMLSLLFLNGLFTSVSVVGPAWTLSVEVWLYLLAPTLARFGGRVLIWGIWLSFAFFTFYSFLRSGYHLPYYSGTVAGIGLLALSFAWLSGWRVYASEANGAKRASRSLALCLMGSVLVRALVELASSVRHHSFAHFYEQLPELGWAVLVLAFVLWALLRRTVTLGLRAQSLFRYLGDISYPLYLSHYTTFELVRRFVPYHPVIVYIVAAIAVSCLMFVVFDRYTTKREKRTAAPIPIR